MKRIEGFENIVPASEYPKLVPGGYICRITGVEDVSQREYLKIEFDIAEGELRGYYLQLFHAKKFWGGVFVRSYKETAQRFFKAFIKAIEESNRGYLFDFEERTLVGKYVGIVLGEEEYRGQDGSIKTRLRVHSVKTVQEIKDGKFSIPEKKLLKQEQEKDIEEWNPVEDMDEEDLPF